mmetsp:Transcript_7041/g.11849  ORF Transcript_7041/g.11849 Transcript_7041/m.11849 type:complete len:90 (-) Transcript_7041:82-351(-)
MPAKREQREEASEEEAGPVYLVKSVIELERIFMIDVVQRGLFKVSLELILHFVNESRHPGTPPKIKRFTLDVGLEKTANERQKLFLEEL